MRDYCIFNLLMQKTGRKVPKINNVFLL